MPGLAYPQGAPVQKHPLDIEIDRIREMDGAGTAMYEFIKAIGLPASNPAVSAVAKQVGAGGMDASEGARRLGVELPQ